MFWYNRFVHLFHRNYSHDQLNPSLESEYGISLDVDFLNIPLIKRIVQLFDLFSEKNTLHKLTLARALKAVCILKLFKSFYKFNVKTNSTHYTFLIYYLY